MDNQREGLEDLWGPLTNAIAKAIQTLQQLEVVIHEQAEGSLRGQDLLQSLDAVVSCDAFTEAALANTNIAIMLVCTRSAVDAKKRSKKRD